MKALYVLACVLLAASIVAETAANQRHSKALQCVAWAASAGAELRDIARCDAVAFVHVGDRISTRGLVSAGVGALLGYVSCRKGGGWTLALPAVLATVYAVTWLVFD